MVQVQVGRIGISAAKLASMNSNPGVPSRLGCGGLLLLVLGLITLPWALLWVSGSRDTGLFVGDDTYGFDEVWWLITPLAAMSIVAVFRLAFGHRDWLAPGVAAAWTLIGLGYAVGTGQSNLLLLAAVVLVLITSGTLADRRTSRHT